jgi:hypothetical protein
VVFECNWITNSTTRTLTMWYFTTDSTFTVHVPSLMAVEFLFIKSRFTTNAQNVLYLNHCRHGHVWSWTVAQFQRSRGGYDWFDAHAKCVGELSFHFQLKAVYANVFTCLHRQNSKGLRSGGRGRCTWKTVCMHILLWASSSPPPLSWCGEMLKFSQAF